MSRKKFKKNFLLFDNFAPIAFPRYERETNTAFMQRGGEPLEIILKGKGDHTKKILLLLCKGSTWRVIELSKRIEENS